MIPCQPFRILLIVECVCVICVLALFSLDAGLPNIFSWHPIYGFGMSNVLMGLIMWEGKTEALQYFTAVSVAFVTVAVFASLLYSRNSRRFAASEVENGESIELIEGDR